MATPSRRTARTCLSAWVDIPHGTLLHHEKGRNREHIPGIIPALGTALEREPFAPVCPALRLCDCECIGDAGDFVRIIDAGEPNPRGAWVCFILNGERIEWTLTVDNDWLDPPVVVDFDALRAAHANKRIYSSHTDFGQSALFLCLTPKQFSRFALFSKVKMKRTAEQA